MKGLKKFVSAFQVKTHIHSSWYFAFLLISGIITSQFPENYPLWQRIIFGIIGFLGFFIVVSVRRFLLNLLSIFIGIPLKNAASYVFGGVAMVPKDTTRPSWEFAMALVGILLNFLIAVTLQLYSLRDEVTRTPIAVALVQWAAFFWYALALLHLFPAFPLEGGKILMTVIWKATRNYIRAVRISGRIGWVLGAVLVVGGFADLGFRREIINGLLLIFLGWVLTNAASQSMRRSNLLESLYNTRALNVMTLEYPSVDPKVKISQLVYDYALVTGQDFFAVVDKKRFLGIITPRNIRKIPKGKWVTTPAENVMVRFEKVVSAQAGQTGAQVLELMEQKGLEYLPVLAGGDLVGVVEMDSLMRLANIHGRLKM